MHRPVLATLMLAATLAACASVPPAETTPDADPAARASIQILGHHCDGGTGVDALAIHVDKPGIATIRWNNEGVCGKPA